MKNSEIRDFPFLDLREGSSRELPTVLIPTDHGHESEGSGWCASQEIPKPSSITRPVMGKDGVWHPVG